MPIPLSLFLFFIVWFIFILIFDILHCFYYSKKCHYDCSSCKYWPCPSHRCNKKRSERRSSDE